MNKHLQEWGNAILRAAIIIVVLFFFCWPMRLMGSSMEPTMGDGEIVLMNRFAAMQGHYEKGDMKRMYGIYLEYLLKHRICQSGFCYGLEPDKNLQYFTNRAAELYKKGYKI